MKIITILLQIVFIHIFLFLGATVQTLFHLPIPASMIGLVLLFLALSLHIIKLEWVEKGGNWLLAELLLFFVPSAVGVVNYNEMFSLQGLTTVIIIGVSTFIVMATTAFIADRIYFYKERDVQ
ncbi:CidA/LrgA family protein [Aquibacillus sediminis]|uniref:CidA/LrgA family protein n=1 Tax=Aquibacillus sediminis TaxID=2574734 RepID=UPI001108CCA4|nr:CidA/LrgA family protein [Aquibacillus sediminis]